MIFRKNYFNVKKLKYSKINYATFLNGLNANYDENLLPVKYAKNTYNFNFKSGALTTGLGVETASLSYNASNRSLKKTFIYPTGVDVLGVWIFNKYDTDYESFRDMVMMYCSDGYMYSGFMYTTNACVAKLNAYHFDTMPEVINYNLNGIDSILMVEKGSNLMYVWDNESTSGSVACPEITSMCLHNERLWATSGGDKRTVMFSDDLNPTNWNYSLTEGGFINLMDSQGVCNKILSFDGSLYVFREFGITKITAYADQTEFNVTQLFTSSNRIYPKTICVCGDRIMFLASDGIYSFNGITTTKLKLNIESMLNANYNDNAIGVYYNGAYYLACRMSFPDDEIGCETSTFTNNALLEFNISNAYINIMRGVDIVNIQTFNDLIENALLVCVKQNSTITLGKICNNGKVFSTVLSKKWSSPKTNFGLPNTKKLIKSITINTTSELTLNVICDEILKAFVISGSDKPQTIFPNIYGEVFELEFISNQAECKISNPQVIIGY